MLNFLMRAALTISLTAFISGTVCASESGTFGAAKTWERFTSALRSGDMKAAHNCFSPLSRKAFGFENFCRHYHPLTAASDATLSPIGDGQFKVSGDMARLRFVANAPFAAKPGTNAPGVFVTAVFVREDDGWYLVAAAREAQAMLEAETRNLLRNLWASAPVSAAARAKKAISEQELAEACESLLSNPVASLVLREYSFKLESNDISGAGLFAIPRHKGLRTFSIDHRNKIIFPATIPPIPDLGDPEATAADIPVPEIPQPGRAMPAEEKDAPPPPPPPDLGDPSKVTDAPASGIIDINTTQPKTPAPKKIQENAIAVPPPPAPDSNLEPPTIEMQSRKAVPVMRRLSGNRSRERALRPSSDDAGLLNDSEVEMVEPITPPGMIDETELD